MARRPHAIADILSELMTRHGYAQLQTRVAHEQAWRQAAGELAAEHSRVGSLKRGVLEVTVVHSTLMQELTFRKSAMLKTLAKLLPDERIKDIRFRAGAIE